MRVAAFFEGTASTLSGAGDGPGPSGSLLPHPGRRRQRPQPQSNPIPRWLFGISLAAAPAAHAAPSPHPSLPAHAPAGPGGAGPSGGGDGGRGGSGGWWAPQPLAALAQASDPVILTLASFAVTKLAYMRITRKFREHCAKAKGQDVRFRLTFGGSGVQARAVIDGLPADVVALALPLDVQKISDSGLLRPDWTKAYPNNATVCETTVALVVRPGNPKGITTWADLTRPEVQVVVANPKTAGVARWIFLALWGTRMRAGDAAARDYVTAVFDNVVVQPRDAREASDVFYRQKVGDVLLTYENEVVLTNEVVGASKELPYVVPSPNVRIECPVALVDAVLATKPREVRTTADEFVRFCFTPEMQAEFGRVGFRPNPRLCKVQPEHMAGKPSPKLWSVDEELGGWAKAQAKFFDAGKILDVIQNEVGARRVEAQRTRGAPARRT